MFDLKFRLGLNFSQDFRVRLQSQQNSTPPNKFHVPSSIHFDVYFTYSPPMSTADEIHNKSNIIMFIKSNYEIIK